MVRIILSGALGKMGRVIGSIVAERNDCTIVAGVDLNTDPLVSFPVYSSPFAIKEEADVIIDFSHPSLLVDLLEYAASKKLPAVIATTGLSGEQIDLIHTCSKQLPLFFTANMSLGVNLMAELAKKAAQILQGFDIEIIEKHHNQKIDAPSGTALMLAEEINNALPSPYQYVYDRHSKRQMRTKAEIGLHSVRGGTIVGEHEVLFCGKDEILSISHSAASKDVFATGAVAAAVFLHGKPKGLYSMKDII